MQRQLVPKFGGSNRKGSVSRMFQPTSRHSELSVVHVVVKDVTDKLE